MTAEQLEAKLHKFAERLTGVVGQKILQELVDYGVEVAKSHVVNIDTGTTLESIHGYVKGNTAVIEAGGNAMWLEFGTGITYNGDGYPMELPEGVSAIGEYGAGHGADPGGWLFPTMDERYAMRDKNGNPMTYPDGTYIAHTYGIKANQFMYQALMAIKEKAPEYGLKIIGEELKAL